MANVFLSYSRSDALSFARELHRRFVRDGITCFFDEASIEWGANWVRALETGIDDCDHLVVILTPGFVVSEWTTVERTSAIVDDPASLKRKLRPLFRQACKIPRFLKSSQYIDVSTDELFDACYPKICAELGGTVQVDAEPIDPNAPRVPPVAQLPTRHRMPFRSLGRRFSGRVEALLGLHTLLMQPENAVVVEGIGVIMGTGGLGKTQLAIEYVHRFGNRYPGGVFWVDADQSISNAIQDLASAARIDIDGDIAVEEQAEALWQTLGQTPAAILIVYDNFPENTPLRPWLPVGASIKTLVTTRRRDLEYPKMTLTFMSDEEALELLNTGDRAFGRDAVPLIEALGGLPLALELARNFLNHRRDISIDTLLEQINAVGTMSVLEMFAAKYADELPTNHRKAVSATIQLSWELASETEQAALALMSYWAPVPVPRRLLHRAHDGETGLVLNDPVEEAIAGLERLSLVELDAELDPQLHRLLRGFVRLHAAEQHPEIVNTAVSVLEEELQRVTVASDTAALEQLEKVLPHGQSILDEGFGNADQSINIAWYLGWHQRNRGRYHLAKGLFQRALEKAELSYEPGHPRIATCQSNLAVLYKDLGDLESAKVLLKKALASDERSYEPDHPNIATSQMNLALVLRNLGDLESARVLLTEAMFSVENSHEPDYQRIATFQSNLALALHDVGDLEGAKKLLTKALASDEENFGSDHPSTATRRSNLAMVLKDLGDLNGARELLTRALSSDQQNYDICHPRISKCQLNLGLVFHELGDLEGARALMTQALASDEQNFQPGHANIATSQLNLAMVLKDLDDLEGARTLLERALASAERSFEPGHPRIATSQFNLAKVLRDLGDLDGASVLARMAYESFRGAFGDVHPSTRAALRLLENIKGLRRG